METKITFYKLAENLNDFLTGKITSVEVSQGIERTYLKKATRFKAEVLNIHRHLYSGKQLSAQDLKSLQKGTLELKNLIELNVFLPELTKIASGGTLDKAHGELIEFYKNSNPMFVALLETIKLRLSTTHEPTEVQSNEDNVRAILQPHFMGLQDTMFENLLQHITADKRPLYCTKIAYIGNKSKLKKAIREIRLLGYDRKHLATVFCEICEIDYFDIYKKI